MPLFDFHCAQCDKTFELLVRGSASATCPQCASQDLQKLISKPAAPGQTADIVRSARAQAKREGHFSNY